MDLNRFAVQLESLFRAAYAKPITINLSTDIEEADLECELVDEFAESLVEEICSCSHVEGFAISTAQSDLDSVKSSRVSLSIEVSSKQIGAPEARTRAMQEFSQRLRESGCGLRLLAISGRWMRYEFVFPPVSPMQQFSGGKVSSGKTILLVEDEEFVRSITAEVLESFGYMVLAAGDSQSAADIFTQNRGKIDLLLTDVVMGERSGIELAEELSGSNPLLRIIIMSGYADEWIGREEFSDGRIAYLQKPFTVDSLISTIRQMFDMPIIALGDQIERTQERTVGG